ncbi:hypothetical protein Pan44_53890 [Caulifigura coniformis]|uniref:Uncharacterized protein n=1 Tax=Caulifigura coniformis TaxID=2527983 RepID=A0A517SMG9_9PLAN|nr:hypothetical protein [Caulifigura coniformis]QDT57321.1 hypothetical protein Pan44_53890 [Caulifigura coniformis]
MGSLTIHTEHGFPHAGVYIEYTQPGLMPNWPGDFRWKTADGEVKSMSRHG